MIAIRRQVSAQESREERYALRRILVGRLQEACRGIPRRTRFEHHRQFAEEWSRFVRDDRLDLVHRALRVGPAVAAEAGEAWRASFLLSLAADVTAPEAPERPLWAAQARAARESSGARAGSALDSSIGAAPDTRPRKTSGRATGMQEDLFPSRFVPQPA